MLSPHGCAERRKRLWQHLLPQLDLVLIQDAKHLTYFANLYISPFTFRANDAQALLVMTPDQCVLMADHLLDPHLDATHVDQLIRYAWYDGLTSPGPRHQALIREAVAFLRELRPQQRLNVGLEGFAHPAALLHEWQRQGATITPHFIDKAVRSLRRTKDADEVAILQKSADAAAHAMDSALSFLQPGMSEMQLFQHVTSLAQNAVGEPVLIYGDFASGERTLQGGGPPTHRIVQTGDWVILDFSVVLWNYRADFANSWLVGASPSPEQKRLYNLCLAALAEGEKRLKPGTPCRDVDQTVRDVFRHHGLETFFPHHAGHGIGLSHPEPPFLVPQSSEVLMPGDVVTLEPGLYVPNMGGMRIERNYFISPHGSTCLSPHRLTLSPDE